MSDKKIARDVAEADVKAWLDFKKVFEETRDKYKDSIEIIVEAVMNGVLILDTTTFEFTHTLLFPIGENSSIDKFLYRARINGKQVDAQMKGVKSDDADGRLNALIAALTSQAKSVIGLLDSADKRIAISIGIFFM